MRIALSVAIVSLVAACSTPATVADHHAAVPTGGYAIVGSVPVSPVSVVQIDSMIRTTVTDKHLVGLSVAVAQDGKVVLAKGYGLKTLGSHDSVSAETMFAVGSVTKQFTCSAVLLLAQDGKLTLQDPVAKYFPKLTRAGDITLLDLGNHVSG
jgi:D-alanyl-D-alanine carboxypeptidase